MKIVLDTNVFISGVFFAGPPFEILNAWRDGRVRLVVSAEIVDEYRRVGERLERDHPGISVGPFLLLVALHAEVVRAPDFPESVCVDPSDDMFFAGAIAAGCTTIVSGDRHLHDASGFGGVTVYRPRDFVDKFLVS